MLNERTGEVFSIARDNRPVPGCTTSKVVRQLDQSSILYFSLAARTDISPETFRYHKLLHVEEGELVVFTATGEQWRVGTGESTLTPVGVPVGMRTDQGCIYTEIEVKEGSTMNEALKAGEVFALADLLPTQDGKIVNMDLVHNDTMKFVLMSFGAGTGLSEHAAPGDAIIFALAGEGVIGYEGAEHVIKAGENFRFAKNGRHYVRADTPFKMALLLTLS